MINTPRSSKLDPELYQSPGIGSSGIGLIFIYLLPIFLAFPLYSEIKVEAIDVDYRNEQVSLKGEVKIQHYMGKMSSQEACYKRIPGENEDFSVLKLNGNVLITLPNDARLQCDRADFNGLERTGIFYGDERQATFTAEAFSKRGDPSPLIITGKKIYARITDTVEELEAEEEVKIFYSTTLKGQTDKLWYEPKAGEETITGIFHMTPHDGSLTLVETDTGDLIYAQGIHLDSGEETVTFDRADGEIVVKSGNNLHFRSDKLTWEDKRERLTMEGRTIVYQKGMGKITSDKSIQLNMVQNDSKHSLLWMESHGKTTISHVDETSGDLHKVTCYGKVNVDHEKFVTTLTSPKVNGRVPKEMRVTFTDLMGYITADSVKLLYNNEPSGPSLTKLTLLGDVYMMNISPIDPNDPTPVRQYALADRVDYNPTTRKLSMIAESPRRVLYFDEINSVQASAPALEAWRNGKTGEDSIRGKGDVRFTLLKNEFDEMKHLFKIQNAVISESDRPQDMLSN